MRAFPQVWTQDYKTFLESLLEKGMIEDIRANHTDADVNFTIKLSPQQMQRAEKEVR